MQIICPSFGGPREEDKMGSPRRQLIVSPDSQAFLGKSFRARPKSQPACSVLGEAAQMALLSLPEPLQA